MKKESIILILQIVLLACVDQISKLLVVNFIEYNTALNIIPGFFNLTYNRNFGAAFGMFQGKRFFFLIVTLFVIGFLIYELKNHKNNKLYKISSILIIGGILGNFIDRVIYGYVIDFLSFSIFNPVFNLADSFIVVGVILFIISILKEGKNESKKRVARK